MVLIKTGDRGAQVMQLQQRLNARPSKLPPLKVDGVFGLKTQARVIEFQRDNGLKADGIVGDITNGKLIGGSQPTINLTSVMNQLGASLQPQQRSAFFGMAQPIASDRALLGSIALIEAAVILMILALIAAMLIASSNKSSQEMGRELDKKIRRFRERLRDEPAQSSAISAASLDAARETARALVKRAQDERQKCFDKFSPQDLAAKMEKCKKFIAAVTTMIQALAGKSNAPTGTIREEDLIKGIMAAAVALIAALRDLGTCMGCDNLFF